MVSALDVIRMAGDELKDMLESVTTESIVTPRNAMKDGRRDTAEEGEWNGTEIFFLDTIGMTARNPMRVVSSSPDGTWILNEDWNQATGVPVGRRYLAVRLHGFGHAWKNRITALKAVISEIQPMQYATDTLVSLGNNRYTVPTTLDSMSNIWMSDGRPLPRNLRRIAGRTIILLPHVASITGPLTAEGRKYVSIDEKNLEADIGDLQLADLADAVNERLTRTSSRPADQVVAGNLYADRLRLQRLDRLPNEVFF